VWLAGERRIQSKREHRQQNNNRGVEFFHLTDLTIANYNVKAGATLQSRRLGRIFVVSRHNGR
jgi:hypothetical protein